MSTPPSLQDILKAIMDTVQTVLYCIVNAISENASLIATVIVLGGLTYMFVRYGSRLWRTVGGFLRGLF